MNITEFKAHINGGGARPNLYKVTIPFPAFAGGADESRRLSFLCKAAQLPPSTLGIIEVPYRGRFIKVAGDRIFQEWNLSVFNDTDFLVRDAFEKWSNGINEHVENTGLELAEYIVDAEVEQLGRNGETLKKYYMRGVWPSEVGAIELGYDQNNIIEEFPVIMQVQWWGTDETTT